jgi:DHA2 family multidrug resistance protein-like MFS transporter
MSSAFISFGVSIFISQYLQLVLGLSPLHAGLWMLPWTLGFIIGAFLTPVLIKYVRPVHLMSIGFALGGAGYLVIMQVVLFPPLTALVVGSLITSISMAPIFTLTTDFILSSAPPEKTGAASAMSETSAEMGGALGIAVLGSLGTAVYRIAMTKNLPASIPTVVADESKDTLGAALEQASKLSSDIGLVSVAKQSFTEALQYTLGACAIIAFVLAVIIYLKLGRTAAVSVPPGTA